MREREAPHVSVMAVAVCPLAVDDPVLRFITEQQGAICDKPLLPWAAAARDRLVSGSAASAPSPQPETDA